MARSDNPYLVPGRLADVIAGITALGLYKFYKLDAVGWADRISGQRRTPEHWAAVFDAHPEFFRRAVTENHKFSLVWRRQFSKRYDVDTGNEPAVGRDPDRVSRRPLDPSELTALIDVAIGMHKSALEHEQAKRWWIPLATAALGFVSALLAVYLASILTTATSGGDPVATTAISSSAASLPTEESVPSSSMP